jgi:hypothetical protein
MLPFLMARLETLGETPKQKPYRVKVKGLFVFQAGLTQIGFISDIF